MKRDVNAAPIMEISVIADKPLADVYSLANDVFLERMQRAGGVSDVQLFGGRDKEVAVEIQKTNSTSSIFPYRKSPNASNRKPPHPLQAPYLTIAKKPAFA